ncbi:MAG: gamma-glutamyl-gamma-aminobutyrate hydrolase family protein, partial [Spirochaetales bacterium]|nr:gamma-glutamyl-gamma-aminobutyrate hydrolase family protein [Candidatus Physcosoma equi]
EEILSGGYDALFLSNGPGDPAYLSGPISMVKECIGKLPLMGICLGHQLITHALGGKTEKMPFGHHGSNHPVIDIHTGRTFVTAQNHGFMTTEESLPETVEVWLRNANDGTVEGLSCPEKKVISIQFHPEAAPGPMEAEALFENLIRNAE